jgi:transcriptional regulator with XRE-family HTH domain
MGYRGKIVEQNRARDLRAQGWTLMEIVEELGVSKASASLWCRDVVIDDAVLAERRRARHLAGNAGARARGPNKLQRRKEAEIEEMRLAGIDAIGQLSDRELLLVGTALYAGEGSKTPGEVRFANSDPRMILAFVEWARRCLDVPTERLRLRLYLHKGLDLDAANAFWSELTGIPVTAFRRPYRAEPDPSIRRAKHPMGCPAVCVTSMRLHRRVMGLVDALLSSTLCLPG